MGANAKTTGKDWDVESDATELSTAPSVTPITIDEAEVEHRAMQDKTVRKFGKVLREMEKLEGRRDLDELQKAKLARKPEIKMEFERARRLAKVRAQQELNYEL